MFYKNIFTSSEILEANYLKTNLIDRISDKDCDKIISVLNRQYEIDKATMEEWLSDVKDGLDIAKGRYDVKVKPFRDTHSYNIQYPLLSTGVSTISARLFTEIHKNIYLANSRITSEDSSYTSDGNTVDQDSIVTPAERRRYNTKMYINAVTVDNMYANWREKQEKMYSKLVLMGTQIKHIKFDQHNDYFCSDFIPYDDIVINNNSPSLDEAVLVTINMYMTINEIKEQVNEGVFAYYDFMNVYPDNSDNVSLTVELGDEDESTESIGVHILRKYLCWLDLDGDSYAEPYTVVVDIAESKILHLSPRIDDYQSTIEEYEEGVKFIKLCAEQEYVDFHYISDLEGGFWSTGLCHVLGPMNAMVNEGLSMIYNTGTLQNKQGGLGSASLKNLGRVDVDMTTYQTIPGATVEDIQRGLVKFDIREPSSIIKEMCMFFIETSDKIIAMTGTLAGDMPNRELPVGSLYMLIDQALKEPKAWYKKIYTSLTKELNIMGRMLSQFGDNSKYIQAVGDPTANIKTDFDPNSLTLVFNSDTADSTVSERLVKLQVIMDFLQKPINSPFVSQKELYKMVFNELDIKMTKDLIVEPPKPAPDPIVVLGEKDLQRKEKEFEGKMHLEQNKLHIKAAETEADIMKTKAETSKIVEEISMAVVNRVLAQLQQTIPVEPLPKDSQNPSSVGGADELA